MHSHPVPFLLLFFVLVFPAVAAGQDREPGSSNLPIGFSPEEKALLNTIGINRSLTPPPTGPVKAAAEWHESMGVFCHWSNPELHMELQKDNDVYVITTNSGWWLSWLSSNGIPSTNYHFLNAPTNTFYTRDYGPWFIWDGNLEFGLVDTIYNRPRPLDDVIPQIIATTYGINYYGPDMVHTGGNYYTDGYGNAWSTRLVFKENPGKTEEEVRQMMSDYLGIHRYITPEIDISIEHFDTFGKILAPDRMIWGQFPENSTAWAFTEGALDYFKTLESAYGWPYKIYRMPLWDYGSSWTAYINALQTNDKILTGWYNTAHDAEAKAIYEAAAPGYKVYNIDSHGTSWGDSIHCRTRNYHQGEQVRIYPRPHWEKGDSETVPYEITAEVYTDIATGLNGPPSIFWTTTGGPPYTQTAMSPTGMPNEYAGSIPAVPHGTTINYYLYAEDLVGRSMKSPFVAPDHCFMIEVENDSEAPDLDHDAIHGLALRDWPFTVSCVAIDNMGIPDVTLEYSINNTPQSPVTMIKEEGTFVFSGEMTGTVSLHDLVAYRIVATDGSVPSNSRSNPALGWNYFTIDPKNAVAMVELDITPDSGKIMADICDDLGLTAHYFTSWPDDLTDFDAAMIFLGVQPTNTALTYQEASSLVSFLTQGGSAYMEGGDCWAQDTSKTVYGPYFGITSATSGDTLPTGLDGIPGEITEGMDFGYYGERNSCDSLTPDGAAQGVLESSGQIKAVTYSTGTYRSVAQSFQIGCLLEKGAPSHIKYLAALYLDHLGFDINLMVHRILGAGRWVTFDLTGDPLAGYMLFYAMGPGYLPMGQMGLLRIDPGTAAHLLSGTLDSSGALRFDVMLPDDPSLSGVEVFFQALAEETSSGTYALTNRDRLVIDIE